MTSGIYDRPEKPIKQKVLEFANKQSEICRRDIMNRFNIARTTAHAALKYLKECGYIHMFGEGKDTYYKITEKGVGKCKEQ